MSRTHKTVAISLRPELRDEALARAKELGFQNSFSAYVSKLIADDLAGQQPEATRLMLGNESAARMNEPTPPYPRPITPPDPKAAQTAHPNPLLDQPINYPAAPGPDQIVAEAAARTIAAARAAVQRRPPAA